LGGLRNRIQVWQSWLYERLAAYELSGRKALNPTLVYMEAWDAHLGHLHRSYPIIHIAGTNGKGSTAAFLASILQWAGYRVGYHTSPHFFRFTERMRVNGEEPPEVWVETFLSQHQSFIEAQMLSFFEVTVGMSLAWFQEAAVDIAVVEVGLGGRWDATNIVHPEVSVITPIDWDHVEILGPTLRHIAREKAGIIKPQRPVIIAPNQPLEALEVFHEVSQSQTAPLYFSGPALQPLNWIVETQAVYRQFLEPQSHTVYLSDLPGDYQGTNMATVLKVVEVLRGLGWNLPEAAVLRGIQEAARTTPLWGRSQWIFKEGVPILLDVAHNPQGFQALRELLSQVPFSPKHILLGFSQEKDHQTCLMALRGLPVAIWTASAQNPRAFPADKVADIAKELDLHVAGTYSSVNQALEKLLATSEPIVVTGSLFIVAEVLAALGADPYQQNPRDRHAPRPRQPEGPLL